MPQTMRTSIYDLFGVGLAVMVGLIIFIGVLKASQRDRFLSSGNNRKWFAYITLWATTAPLFYWWGSPAKISLSDAYQLQVTAAGWPFVLMGYAAFLGLLLGTLVVVVVRLIVKKPQDFPSPE